MWFSWLFKTYIYLKLPFRSQSINFIKVPVYFKKLAYIYYNKCFLWTSLCWVLKKNNTALVFILSNNPQILKIFYDWHVKYYLLWFQYMITRLKDLVQLSISSTNGLFYTFIVAMKYRWIYKFLIVSESPSLNEHFRSYDV